MINPKTSIKAPHDAMKAPTMPSPRLILARQAGAALLVALIMLILITLIGISAARMQTMEARMSSNLQNRNLAMQSAESALRTAEDSIAQNSNPVYGNTAGQYIYSPASGNPPWYLGGTIGSTFWTTSSNLATGPVEATDSSQASVYIIEQLPSVSVAGGSASLNQFGNSTRSIVYRITAKATGGDTTAPITLQSIYH